VGVTKASVRGVSLAQASRIVEEALTAARARALRPMSIAVVDAGGDLVAFKREDHTGIRRFDIAFGKAFGALVMNRSSRMLGEMGAKDPLFLQSLMANTGGKIIPTPGGVLIKDSAGLIIGAVGSSGDEVDEDEAVAIIAIHAAGLMSEPEQPRTSGR
jgi:uncharacterized protein GlcG (DUF336 family)